MVAIPSDDTARRAWAALPGDVRAEVAQLAARDRGHPDPAVAAIAVGLARAERWPWWRTAMFGTGLCLFWGECLALLLFGGSVHDIHVRGGLVLVAPAFLGFAMFAAASTLRMPGALPRGAEVANLRVFLASRQAEAAEPRVQPRRRWLTRRRAVVAAGFLFGTAAVAYAVTVLMRLPLRPAEGLQQAIDSGVFPVLVLGGSWLVRRLRIRRRPREAKRVTVGPDGLRFDRRDPIPWSEVTGATLRPVPGRLDMDGVIVWMVRRDAPTVETPLHSGPLPEELILAAVSHMEAAKRSSAGAAPH